MNFYPYLHEKMVLTSDPSIDEQQPLNTGAHEKKLKTWLTNVFQQLMTHCTTSIIRDKSFTKQNGAYV